MSLRLPRRLPEVARSRSTRGAGAAAAAGEIAVRLATQIKQLRLPNAASLAQLEVYVRETLEHNATMKALGRLRGEDWSAHDLEGDSSKLQPRIAAQLARPTWDPLVSAAQQLHRAAPHHAVWARSGASMAELKESASDIIASWRMQRAYKKPWSYQDILLHLSAAVREGKLSLTQRDALLEAIPFQQQYERTVERR